MKILSVFLLFFIINANAQESILTIQDAVKSAFDRNTELQQLYARLKQKKNNWRSETGISAPEFNYFKEGIGSGPGDLFDEKRISVSQEIDFPLTTIYRLKGIGEEVKAIEFRVKAVENEVKADVKSQYVEVLYALYLQRSRQDQLELSQELYDAVYTKFEIGMANGIDLANAGLMLEDAKNDLDQSEWILHKARYGLFYAMGLPENEQKYSIEFSDTLLTKEIEISQIESLSAKKDQPFLMAVNHEYKATDYFLKEAKSNILPDLSLSIYKQNFGEGYDFRGFELGLKIPLWYGFDQKGKIYNAKARKEEIYWKKQEVSLDIKKQIEYAWHNYSVSRSIIKRYNSTMKNKAAELQNLSLRAYQLGEVDLLNLLNAQKIYLASEQRYLTALRDHYLQLISLEKYLDQELVF